MEQVHKIKLRMPALCEYKISEIRNRRLWICFAKTSDFVFSYSAKSCLDKLANPKNRLVKPSMSREIAGNKRPGMLYVKWSKRYLYLIQEYFQRRRM